MGAFGRHKRKRQFRKWQQFDCTQRSKHSPRGSKGLPALIVGQGEGGGVVRSGNCWRSQSRGLGWEKEGALGSCCRPLPGGRATERRPLSSPRLSAPTLVPSEFLRAPPLSSRRKPGVGAAAGGGGDPRIKGMFQKWHCQLGLARSPIQTRTHGRREHVRPGKLAAFPPFPPQPSGSLFKIQLHTPLPVGRQAWPQVAQMGRGAGLGRGRGDSPRGGGQLGLDWSQIVQIVTQIWAGARRVKYAPSSPPPQWLHFLLVRVCRLVLATRISIYRYLYTLTLYSIESTI